MGWLWIDLTKILNVSYWEWIINHDKVDHNGFQSNPIKSFVILIRCPFLSLGGYRSTPIKQAITSPFWRMDRTPNLWSYEVWRRVITKELGEWLAYTLRWRNHSFVKLIHFLNIIMTWPVLLWYCILNIMLHCILFQCKKVSFI